LALTGINAAQPYGALSLQEMMLRFLLPLLLVVCCISCNREPVSYAEAGILTGPDVRLCACCGGVILQTNSGNVFHIESLPGMMNEDLYKLTFPKKIEFNWKPDRECGGIVYIKIKSYKFY
jgi:hypothetical protein